MNKGTAIFIAIAVSLVLLVMWGIVAYNTLIGLDQAVSSAWSQVENQYQRRADLIPNLVNTVKGFAAQEREVLTGVVEARAKATSIQVTKEVLEDPEAFAKFQSAQDQFSTAISRLLAVAENYPVLRSNENFLSLQNELAGTENRIAVERRRFNEVVQTYNTTRARFPGVIIANLAGFREKAYFKAKEGADAPPDVKF
ncbi:MAG: LemA family protein [Ignavibacteria bacterium]